MAPGFNLPTFPSLLTAPNAPFIHRDLSWLQFNERVLAEAHLETNPLLERIKFLSISSTNLDEFFMIRYPSLVRTIKTTSRTDKRAALRLLRIRNDILEAVHRFVEKQAHILRVLLPQLRLAQIHFHELIPTGLDKKIFDEEILPHLIPPEPFSPSKIERLENLQLGAVFHEENNWLRIPRSLPSVFCRWHEGTSEFHAFFLDDLLLRHLGPTFHFKKDPVLIRLTRDWDFKVDLEEEDTESIPDIVRSGLGTREKGRPSRLQYFGKPTKAFLNQVMKALKMVSGQVLAAPDTLCLHGISSIRSFTHDSVALNAKLCYPPLQSIIPNPLKNPSHIFDRLDQEDLLLHHPYDSFEAFVSWIRAACEDPHVVKIEQTVYRMDTVSPVISLLKAAAKSKKIRVIIELRARFDELNNLRLADDLQKAGVEVAFGFGKLKLHGKVALVTRTIEGQTRLYAHLSTGNYNATTARQYTDLSILTSHAAICSDVRHFFDRVSVGEVPNDFKCLVPAPDKLHRRLLSYIHKETEAAEKGRKARVVVKVNALVDDAVVQQLYRASQAGVQVDLIVRGACSLVPGVKGLSENIRVISIVDRFLEHSRIYYFGDAQKIYLSSADWMPRNFFSRLELAFPVLDPHLYRYIKDFIIPVYLSDTVKAHELSPEGKWKRRRTSSIPKNSEITKLLHPGEKGVRSQFLFEEMACREYEGTPLWKKIYSNRPDLHYSIDITP